MNTEHNDFDAGPANELARRAIHGTKIGPAIIDELDRVATRDPEDPEGSPWPAIAVVATVLGAAAAAWWCA